MKEDRTPRLLAFVSGVVDGVTNSGRSVARLEKFVDTMSASCSLCVLPPVGEILLPT